MYYTYINYPEGMEPLEETKTLSEARKVVEDASLAYENVEAGITDENDEPVEIWLNGKKVTYQS